MANGLPDQGKKPRFWQRRYFIDKRFQGRFILRYSAVVVISALVVIVVLFLLRNKAYSLLPDGASVLTQVDVDNFKVLKQDKDGKWQVVGEGEGEEYFPLKIGKNGFRFYSAFDLYLWPVIVVTLLNVVIIMIYSVFFSHKVAGPIYKIKKILNHYIATGEFFDIKLRKGDALDDVARLINHAVRRHERRPDQPRGNPDGNGQNHA
ncbi:MAG: hypothetical protein N2Z22_07555 [Turneriella sp.]|nr:hypothetical protein [Turneriella sp.]